MREIKIDRFGTPEVLQLQDAPAPQSAPDEVLVRVAYAGLNPVDAKIRDGSNRLAEQLELPAVLGREFVGEIVAAGDDVDLIRLGLQVGSRVFGVRPGDDLRGAYAEMITIDPTAVAPVPAEVTEQDLPAFGGLALAGVTALSTIEDQAQLGPQDSVLVHGGSGGVGQLLIPLARAAGCTAVYATGAARNLDRLRELGATPIAYDEGDWEAEIDRLTDGRGVDVVLDTHYFSTFEPSLDHLAPGGRVVVLPTLADVSPAEERGIPVSITRMRATRERLDRLAAGVVAGELPLEVSIVLPLAEVARGHEQLAEGHTRGKIVLDVRA